MYVVHVKETDPSEGIEGVDRLVRTTVSVTSLKDAVKEDRLVHVALEDRAFSLYSEERLQN